MQNAKMNIKKNDKVKVVTGKDKGKIGKVLSVDREKERLVIENVNMMKHHVRPNVHNRQGGIVEKENPVRRSNVMLMCGKCVKPTRIKIKVLEDGRKARMCGKCNELID
ncbi:MAG: 50S ribosomal protein L24 [Thermodesulfobacteriota bacterium]|nr:50S ribosomal protein L24 [Thermodesulfobacteriota bacterium]